ncbi:MAG: response regulator [Treponema sp.]|nr:response regulator [Treponema sp.]
MFYIIIIIFNKDLDALNNSQEKKHILIVSEEPRVLAELKSELTDYFDISITATSKAALAAMEMYEMSAIVIYIYENRKAAFSVFSDIFGLAKSKNIPITFLTERGNDEDENTAFALGAVDYSAKRSGTADALINRIKLRINSSENEKKLIGSYDDFSSDKDVPETFLVNKTILIADDVELNKDIISAMLSEIEGLAIEFASDGKEAVEKFEKAPNKYFLILMDVHMPVMDGLEATRNIRRLSCENARKIPIIAVTASTDEKEIELCLKAGMNNILVKPISYEKFLAVSAEYCKENGDHK